MGEELFTGTEASRETFEVQESHIWFNKAVARWLDIALYKAMQRIIKEGLFNDFPNLSICPGCNHVMNEVHVM